MHSAERKEGSSLKHLVKKAQQGDARAFVRLIEINKQSMYKIARSYFTNDEDIADAIQDTIETCYRSIRHLADPGYFRTWMTRILINKCIDIIRKNKKEHPVSEFRLSAPVLQRTATTSPMRSVSTPQRKRLMKSASPRVMFRRVMSTRQTAHMRANGTTKRRKEA